MTAIGWLRVTESFKVAYLSRLSSPLVVEDAYFQKLERGQVLVKIIALGVCGSQIAEIEGKKGNVRFLPHLLGHEGIARVVEVHSTVTKIVVGDRVVIHWRKGTGIESGPIKIRTSSGRILGGGPATTFSEYSIVGENRVTKVSEDIGIETGVLLGCGLSTGLGSVDKDVNLSLGARVLVTGLGGVGLSVLAAANAKGAAPIVSFDMFESKGALAMSLGATRHFTKVEELTNYAESPNNKFDYIFEVTGSVDLRRLVTGLLAPGGSVVFIGQSDPLTEMVLGSEKLAFGAEGVSLIFSQGGNFIPELDIPRWGRLLENRSVQMSVLSHRVMGQLEDLNGIISKMKSGEITGRPVLELH
jgi:S-(hydroxymethyl)glutathione dehydrogenase / alcohol dehydrogenase